MENGSSGGACLDICRYLQLSHQVFSTPQSLRRADLQISAESMKINENQWSQEGALQKEFEIELWLGSGDLELQNNAIVSKVMLKLSGGSGFGDPGTPERSHRTLA